MFTAMNRLKLDLSVLIGRKPFGGVSVAGFVSGQMTLDVLYMYVS